MRKSAVVAAGQRGGHENTPHENTPFERRGDKAERRANRRRARLAFAGTALALAASPALAQSVVYQTGFEVSTTAELKPSTAFSFPLSAFAWKRKPERSRARRPFSIGPANTNFLAIFPVTARRA
jgi:hypothetical protein